MRTPRLKGIEIIRVLKKMGFNVVRQRGSHVYLAHSDGRATVVPIHSGETIGPGLFHKILRDIEITKKEFIEILKK
jgi:predicted RNA binding protein YcfA (HicA-like mRNA interferase family)